MIKWGSYLSLIPKQNELLPGHFRHLPAQIYLEGVREGAAEPEINLTVEYKENHNVIGWDTIKITVTPLLTKLKVKVAL